LIPIFTRLSDSKLLKSRKAGFTKNQNELINSVMWTYCPKKLFGGINRFTIASCDAISQFNDGSSGRYQLFKSLNVTIGDNKKRALTRKNNAHSPFDKLLRM